LRGKPKLADQLTQDVENDQKQMHRWNNSRANRKLRQPKQIQFTESRVTFHPWSVCDQTVSETLANEGQMIFPPSYQCQPLSQAPAAPFPA